MSYWPMCVILIGLLGTPSAFAVTYAKTCNREELVNASASFHVSDRDAVINALKLFGASNSFAFFEGPMTRSEQHGTYWSIEKVYEPLQRRLLIIMDDLDGPATLTLHAQTCGAVQSWEQDWLAAKEAITRTGAGAWMPDAKR